MLRVQPFWGVVRPFVEGAFGFAALWRSTRVRDPWGGAHEREDMLDIAALWGVSMGLDWRLRRAEGSGSRVHVVLTTAVKRWYTSRMQPIGAAAYGGPGAIAQARMAAWTPTIALALTFDSRVRRR